MVKFYRLETAEGVGPYILGGGLPSRVDFELHMNRIHGRKLSWQWGYDRDTDPTPAPRDDGFGEIPQNYAFGFVSWSDLNKWFSRAVMNTSPLEGYAVSMYDVPGELIIRGGQQAMAPKNTLLNPKKRIPVGVAHRMKDEV